MARKKTLTDLNLGGKSFDELNKPVENEDDVEVEDKNEVKSEVKVEDKVEVDDDFEYGDELDVENEDAVNVDANASDRLQQIKNKMRSNKKKAQNKQVTVYLKPELFKKFNQECKDKGSKSQLVNNLLELYFSEDE